MDKTLIVGANGQIGRLLIAAMVEQSMPVLAMVRTQQQKTELEQLGAEAIIGDLEQALPDEAFEQCDKVVFTAGSGGHTGADKTILVDLWGACKVVDKAARHGLKQFVMVSSRDAGNPDQGTPAIRHYNVCKHFADEYLLDSGVPYTILRPGKLTDSAASEQISIRRSGEKEKQVISRANVAAVIRYCLQTPSTIGHVYQLYDGEQPIEQALQL